MSAQPAKPIIIPPRVNSVLLMKHLQQGEPVIVVKIADLGMTSDFDMQVGNRSYLFRWDHRKGGHILRVPHSIWHQNKEQMANEIMYQRKLRYPVIVTVDLPEGATISKAQGGEAASRQSHNLENEGSNPSPETIPVPPSNEGFVEDVPTDQPQETAAPCSQPAQDSGVIMYGEIPLHQAVAALLDSGSTKLKAAAHHLDVSEDSIRAALKEPASTIRVGNAGWILPKEKPAAE